MSLNISEIGKYAQMFSSFSGGGSNGNTNQGNQGTSGASGSGTLSSFSNIFSSFGGGSPNNANGSTGGQTTTAPLFNVGSFDSFESFGQSLADNPSGSGAFIGSGITTALGAGGDLGGGIGSLIGSALGGLFGNSKKIEEWTKKKLAGDSKLGPMIQEGKWYPPEKVEKTYKDWFRYDGYYKTLLREPNNLYLKNRKKPIMAITKGIQKYYDLYKAGKIPNPNAAPSTPPPSTNRPPANNNRVVKATSVMPKQFNQLFNKIRLTNNANSSAAGKKTLKQRYNEMKSKMPAWKFISILTFIALAILSIFFFAGKWIWKKFKKKKVYTKKR